MLTRAILTPRSYDVDRSSVAIDPNRDCHGTLCLHRRVLRNSPTALWRGVFRRRSAAVRPGRERRLLDLGAGPGILAIGFAPYCRDVVGVDPEPGMVQASRAGATRASVAVRFV